VELVVAAVWYEPQILMVCPRRQARQGLHPWLAWTEGHNVPDWYSPTEIAFSNRYYLT